MLKSVPNHSEIDFNTRNQIYSNLFFAIRQAESGVIYYPNSYLPDYAIQLPVLDDFTPIGCIGFGSTERGSIAITQVQIEGSVLYFSCANINDGSLINANFWFKVLYSKFSLT